MSVVGDGNPSPVANVYEELRGQFAALRNTHNGLLAQGGWGQLPPVDFPSAVYLSGNEISAAITKVTGWIAYENDCIAELRAALQEWNAAHSVSHSIVRSFVSASNVLLHEGYLEAREMSNASG